jgi:hypothetical protein
MTTDEEILFELKKVNTKLDDLNNPLKKGWNHLLSGLISSIGWLIGLIAISVLSLYLWNKLNLTQIIMNSVMKNLTVPSLQLSPGQL